MSKTNHQRNFVAQSDAPREWLRSGMFVGNDFTNGKHGLARARHGLKKHFRNKTRKENKIEARKELILYGQE